MNLDKETGSYFLSIAFQYGDVEKVKKLEALGFAEYRPRLFKGKCRGCGSTEYVSGRCVYCRSYR